MPATALPNLPAGVVGGPASWTYYDNDQVNQAITFGRTEALRMTGAVDWHYLSSNSDNRYLSVNVRAYQSTNYAPLCIGVQMMVFRQSKQTTVGGEVQGSWGLTGPSVAIGASYSQTTSTGSTSDGLFWRCPQGERYVPGGTTLTWQENLHPQFGTGVHVAFMACIATSPTSPQRWCSPWDPPRPV